MWYLFDSGICRITNLNVVGDFKKKKKKTKYCGIETEWYNLQETHKDI